MRWDDVIQVWLDRLATDAALVDALNDRPLTPANAAEPVTIPSADYSFIYEDEGELFVRFGVQVTIFAPIGRAAVIESRIRQITHRDVSYDLGGLRLWSRFIDARSTDYPAQRGVIQRSVDFEFEIIRAKYADMVAS